MTSLRKELMPPPLDKARLARLVRLANQIVDAIDRGKNATALVASFNKEAATNLNESDIGAFPSSIDAETFVKGVISAPPKKMDDITYEELLELVARLCNASGSEHETHYWLAVLKANLPDPRISDLIYWPGEYFGDGDNSREMSPKEILDTALAARLGQPKK